jgi:multicomponent Na+:H+ antiporter subunit D
MLGLLGTALALGIAAMTLWPSRRVRARAGAASVITGRVRTLLVAVERTHSGHVGDYASWLVGSIAVLALLVWNTPG